ncbi:hypothetical protein KC19_VG210400 [Ceratodon purpureus]|uniref:Uncharacterized protein n=1 Tax=Ceratodon purpureus TaxID=3225 RepID=A0A8T0HTG2_CERPU|nr:hypothetical protein KC19_VG210400 [Ceratodon purpureus]
MDSENRMPSRMSARRINDGPVGIHDTMLEVVELAIFRLDRYLKRHQMPVQPWVEEWKRPSVELESIREPPPATAATFLDSLPREVVKDVIWPLLMDGQTPVEKLRVLCNIRCVCLGWMIYAEGSKEWPLGLEAWIQGDHRVVAATGKNPYFNTDSE